MIAKNIRKWPEQLREEGYQKAQAEAEKRLQEEKQTTAKSLLAMNMMTDDQIAQVTGLELQVIQTLRQSITQHRFLSSSYLELPSGGSFFMPLFLLLKAPRSRSGVVWSGIRRTSRLKT